MKKIIFFTLFLVLIAVIVMFLTANTIKEEPMVQIKTDYGSKIIYQLDSHIPLDSYQVDCQARGGTFNDCGLICPPPPAGGSEVCVEVCGLVCEFPETEPIITNFEECVKADHLVRESYPRQCQANGQTFVEDVGNVLEKYDLIQLYSPLPNDKISSPLLITGQARGYWFFEASFPVVLVDWDGLIIAEGYVTALDEWMTEEFVEFKGELTFDKPGLYDYGALILQKDNPSGLPANDDALEIPIKFE